MNKNNLNSYKLKITALSPIHIGTGEVYEPTNFVIDGGVLYEFDEVLFYKSLSDMDKKAFETKLGDWMQIIDFYKKHKDNAKNIAKFSCKVSKKVSKKYDTTTNKDGSKNRNQFEIHKTFKNPNTYKAIIPGSSIKGMFDTILGIYPPKSSNEERQKLVISDATLLEGGVEVGFCYRKHKNPSKSAKSPIPQMVEIIKSDSTFILTLKTEKSFEDIKSFMKKYHNERDDSKYQESANSFIARVGKFSGKEYMVDNGKNVKNSFEKPIATHTLHENDEPFGWIKLEQLNEEEYQESFKDIQEQEDKYFKEIEDRQKSIKEKIYRIQKEAELNKEQERLQEIEEQQKTKEEKTKREAELVAMSLIEKIIDSYDGDIPTIINAMKDNSIENIDEIKIELSQALKVLMQEDPKQWEKAKQKAQKRKEYIEEILK